MYSAFKIIQRGQKSLEAIMCYTMFILIWIPETNAVANADTAENSIEFIFEFGICLQKGQ